MGKTDIWPILIIGIIAVIIIYGLTNSVGFLLANKYITLLTTTAISVVLVRYYMKKSE